MKKLLILLLAAALLLTGCANKNDGTEPQNTEADNPAEQTETPQRTTALYDLSGKKLAELPEGSFTMTDKGVFYSVVTKETGMTHNAEYRLYSPETGEDKLLGATENEGYEAYYARTELEGRLYALAVIGDLMDDKPDELCLLEFDHSGSMKTVKISGNGFPYCAMCAAGKKLLIMLHDQQSVLYDRVLEYDPATGDIEEKLTFELADSGESLRHLCCDGERVYMLRLTYGPGVKLAGVTLDEYDLALNKLGERDVKAPLYKAAEDIAHDDPESELMQPVSHLIVKNGYMYYENFSVTHCIIELETGEVTALSDLLAASFGAGEPVYCVLYDSTFEAMPKGNVLYTFNGTGFDPIPSCALKDGAQITAVTRAANGRTIALTREAEGSSAYLIDP